MHCQLLLSTVSVTRGWCAEIVLLQFSGMELLAVGSVVVGNNLLHVAFMWVCLVQAYCHCIAPEQWIVWL